MKIRQVPLWAMAAAVCGVALELYVLAAMPNLRVSADGAHRVALTEFGMGTPVAQGFALHNEGLHAVRVRLVSSAPADLDVNFRLSLRDAGRMVDHVHATFPIADVSGESWQTFEFPAIHPSAGRDFVVELRLVDARARGAGPRPSIALVASRDRPLRFSSLAVGGQERWGDLVFEALAIEDTWFGRVRLKVLPALPPSVRQFALILAALSVYNVVFFMWLFSGPTRAIVASGFSRTRGGPAEGGHRIGTSATVTLARAFVALLLLAGGLGGMAVIARVERGRINLIDHLYAADLQGSMRPSASFDVLPVEIGIETQRALFAHATSRIAWHVVLPPNARLRTALAIHPNAWTPGGDGVVFRIAVVDGGAATELLTRHLNPHVLGDQRWIPVDLDLSRLAGRAVDIVFVTEPSLPGQPVDGSYDWALWGEPRIN